MPPGPGASELWSKDFSSNLVVSFLTPDGDKVYCFKGDFKKENKLIEWKDMNFIIAIGKSTSPCFFVTYISHTEFSVRNASSVR